MAKLDVPLCKPDVGKDELDAIAATFATGQLSHGAYIPEFEAAFAAYCGVPHAVALNSCTSGLYLLCLYVRERYGVGEIIVPSFTFAASVNSILCAGMTPRFVDVEWQTGNTTAELIAPLITKDTKAVMVVHYAGKPCDMPAIMKLADQHNLFVIEDSAECLGAKVGDRQAGSYGHGVFSFYSTKNMTTGEGGMVTTHDPDVADWCRLKRAHGVRKQSYNRNGIQRVWFRNAVIPGQNFRLANFQAAMGLVQLKKLQTMNQARRKVAERYIAGLSDLKQIELPALAAPETHSWQMFIIKVPADKRDDIVLALNEKGVGASVHFDPPVHWQDIVKTVSAGKLPITEKLALSSITLPISSVQTQAQTNHVIAELRNMQWA